MSLDIPELQVLVHYPADPHGFFWHQRILLKRVGDGRWVTLTPDEELAIHDLAAQRHEVCERNAPFPQPAGQVYGFDPLGRGELDA